MPVKLFTFSPPSCVLCPVTWPVIVEIEGSCLGLWDINDVGFLKSKLYQGLPMNGSISTTTRKIISKNFSLEKNGLAYVVCGCNFFSQTQWSIICEIRWCSGDLNSHTWNRSIVSPAIPSYFGPNFQINYSSAGVMESRTEAFVYDPSSRNSIQSPPLV